LFVFFFFPYSAPPAISTLSLHDALRSPPAAFCGAKRFFDACPRWRPNVSVAPSPTPTVNLTTRVTRSRSFKHSSQAAAKLSTTRSEEHTSELQSRGHLVCRLLLEKKKR